MKTLYVLATAALFSCAPIKPSTDLVGKTKKDALMLWGIPEEKSDDGNGGEILKFAGPYGYNYVYIGKDSLVYHERFIAYPQQTIEVKEKKRYVPGQPVVPGN